MTPNSTRLRSTGNRPLRQSLGRENIVCYREETNEGTARGISLGEVNGRNERCSQMRRFLDWTRVAFRDTVTCNIERRDAMQGLNMREIRDLRS